MTTPRVTCFCGKDVKVTDVGNHRFEGTCECGRIVAYRVNSEERLKELAPKPARSRRS